MRVDWTRTVDPAIEPVTVAFTKLHCRGLDIPDEDVLFDTYARAAREIGETITGRAWITQTWRLSDCEWADEFPLPMAAPLQSVTSVKYYAADGTLTTLDPSYYTVETIGEPGRVVRAPNKAWPALQSDRLSSRVQITYVCGWTSAAIVPPQYRVGAALLVGHLYENRESVQVGVGIGAVELPLGISTFFSDRVYYQPPVGCW